MPSTLAIMALQEVPMEATMATLELTMDNDMIATLELTMDNSTMATLELTMDKGGETDGGITTGTWYLCSREKQRLRPMPAPSTLAIMALLLLEVTTEATMATLEVTMDNNTIATLELTMDNSTMATLELTMDKCGETDGRITTWYLCSREKRRLRLRLTQHTIELTVMAVPTSTAVDIILIVLIVLPDTAMANGGR